jgi:hypothetical protein
MEDLQCDLLETRLSLCNMAAVWRPRETSWNTTPSVLGEPILILDRSSCHRLLVLLCVHPIASNTCKRLFYLFAIAIHARKVIRKRASHIWNDITCIRIITFVVYPAPASFQECWSRKRMSPNRDNYSHSMFNYGHHQASANWKGFAYFCWSITMERLYVFWKVVFYSLRHGRHPDSSFWTQYPLPHPF